MSETKATAQLKKLKCASDFTKQNPDQGEVKRKSDTELFQDDDIEVQPLFSDLFGQRLEEYEDVYHEAAEDADDENDSDNGYVDVIQHLNTIKAKTVNSIDQGM